MDYQPGGELFSYLREQGTFTEVIVLTCSLLMSLLTLILQETTRFYLAEMILALEHLHSHGIIHRYGKFQANVFAMLRLADTKIVAK